MCKTDNDVLVKDSYDVHKGMRIVKILYTEFTVLC